MAEDTKNKRLLMIVIAVGILALIAVLVYWQFFSGTEDEPADTTPQVNTNTDTLVVNVSVNTAVNENVNTAEVDGQLSLSRLASLFTERFGSYSSDAEYQNTIDLKKYMTNSMRSWADNYVLEQRSRPATDDFNSVVTRVVSTKIASQTDDSATVNMITQRTEEGTNINGQNSFYQNMILELVYDDEDWLVKSATWQAR